MNDLQQKLEEAIKVNDDYLKVITILSLTLFTLAKSLKVASTQMTTELNLNSLNFINNHCISSVNTILKVMENYKLQPDMLPKELYDKLRASFPDYKNKTNGEILEDLQSANIPKI